MHCHCGKRATFGPEGGKAMACKTHADEGMVDVLSKRCNHEGCNAHPFFNVEGETRGIRCKAHALEGMVNVVSKRCEHEGCVVRNPAFNVGGEKRGIRCKVHALEGMVNVVSRRCEHEGCVAQPSFNVEGEKRGIRCKTHALRGMVDVKSKRCEHEGCALQPAFNVKGETRGIMCKAHALKGMVDVLHKRCEHEGCDARPSFNVDGKGGGIRCKSHALKGMVDVENKRCDHEGCALQPAFNVVGKRGIRCKAHATEGMVDVRSKRCEHEGCALSPAFNVKGEKRGRFCKTHATRGMVDVKSPQCKLCAMFYVRKRGDLCYGCRLGTEKAKRKEIEVKEALDTHAILKDYTIHDTRHGCGERAIRPDFAWEVEDLVVILEVDEFAHKNYEPRCEIARLHELQAAFAKPLAVIRYNPDAPWTKLGKRKRGEDEVKDKHAFAAQLVLAALQDRTSAIFTDASVVVHGSDALRIVYAGYPAAIVTELLATVEAMHAEVCDAPA